MQIALQDIRILGYKKIIKLYLDGGNKETFLNKIDVLNTLCNSMRIPAYSLLNKWNLLGGMKGTEELGGYSLFIHNIESMIDLEEPSIASKRKCRNSWNSIWDSFGEVTELESYQTIMLKDFGLKAIFLFASLNASSSNLDKMCSKVTISDSLYDSLIDILHFYNIVLKWAVFTQQECNFSKNNICFVDVLSMLVVSNKEDFERSLKNIC